MENTRFDPERHHRRSIRLRGYDYGRAGAYFITICTSERRCFLGDIVSGVMNANPYGQIVTQWWSDLSVRGANVRLDAFVLMPNHIHGILILSETDANEAGEPAGGRVDIQQRDRLAVGRGDLAPTDGSYRPPGEINPSVMTLGQAVGWFKYQSAKSINAMRNSEGCPVWQRNYYEHIVRQNELDTIRRYILGNPANWKHDENYQDL